MKPSDLGSGGRHSAIFKLTGGLGNSVLLLTLPKNECIV